MEEIVSFGEWVRRRRQALGLTRVALASQVGCSPVTIKKIERDERRPSVQIAVLLADNLGIEPQQRGAFVSFARMGPSSVEVPRPPADLGDESFHQIDLPRVPAASLPEGIAHNLPSQATPFIGRERELAELQALLADPQTRLLTIVGPGGIGKTRLALAYAERVVEGQRAAPKPEQTAPLADTLPATFLQKRSFENGVFFVDLAPLDDVAQVVPAMAGVLKFPLQGGRGESRSPKQQILDYLRRKKMLLLMDNFEHLLGDTQLLDGAELVTDILGTAPGVQILVTSRERLRLHEEQLFPIQGLEYLDAETGFLSAEDPLAVAADFAAAELFLQSARRVQPHFVLKAADLPHLNHICRLVEGMPLALALAAFWVELMSLADIASEIQQGLDLLETDIRNVPPRQREIRAVFDVSWQRMPPAERALMRQISVFRGGFTRHAIQAITRATLRQLGALANKSWLQYDQTADRYRVHELLRQYAAEKLAQDEAQAADARDRHSAYYCQVLADLTDDIKGSRQLEALAEIAADIENIRHAWEWAVEQVEVAWLGRALDGLCLFYEYRSRFDEGEGACRLLADRLEALTSTEAMGAEGADMLRLQARNLAWQASLSNGLGNLEKATTLLQKSFALLEMRQLRGHDTRPEKALLSQISSIIHASIDGNEAIRLAQASESLYRSLDDRWGLANALAGSGRVVTFGYEPSKLQSRLEESLAIRRSLGDLRGIASSLGSLAMITGHHEVAERMKQESIAIFRKIGDRGSAAAGLFNLSALFVHLGKFNEALNLADEYMAIGDDLGGWTLAAAEVVTCYPNLYLGNYEEAQKQAEQSLNLYRSMEDNSSYGVGLAFDALGRIVLAREAYVEANQWLRDSLPVYQALGMINNVTQATACLGYADRGLGRHAEARRHLTEALRPVADSRDYLTLVHAFPGIALVLADEGEATWAVELYALAMTQGMVANSQWFEDVAGRHIKEAAAALPAEVVAAAEARGRARDLWETAAELSEELEALGWGEEAANAEW